MCLPGRVGSVNGAKTMTTTTQTAHTTDASLIGRAWESDDGVCVVLGFTAAGMARVERPCGRVQQMAPSIVVAALAASGIEQLSLSEIIARSDAACA